VRRRVVVTGRVQGVGYRWTAATEAERLGVRGSIRNLDDGEVEATLVGDPEAVGELIEWMRVGPAGARVDDVEIEDLPDDGSAPTGFRIQ
jgi:acylphosphatase